MSSDQCLRPWSHACTAWNWPIQCKLEPAAFSPAARDDLSFRMAAAIINAARARGGHTCSRSTDLFRQSDRQLSPTALHRANPFHGCQDTLPTAQSTGEPPAFVHPLLHRKDVV